MSDFLELYAVLAAIYLFDCVHWARREAVGIRAFFGARKLVVGDAMPGNERFGILLANPLPPFGSLFLVQRFAVAWTRDGASSFVSHADNPGPRPPQIARVIQWDEIASITAETRTVRVDGAAFVTVTSETLARRIAAFMERMRTLEPGAREREIEREIEASLGVDAAVARITDFEASVRALRTACNALFVHLFVVVPAIALQFGLGASWMPLIGGLAAAQTAVVWLFARAHARLHPDERGERRAAAWMLAVSPPAAIRAPEVLSRDLLAEIHPLAAARILVSAAEFEAFAEAVLRDALHPLPIVRENPSEAARAADLEWRARFLAAAERFCERAGMQPARWRSAPERTDPDCETYCPRCAAHYLLATGECARCPGIALRRW